MARRMTRRPTSRLTWEAREVLRDIAERPHLMTRIRLSGSHFPQRALAPFVRIGSALTAWIEIDEDEQSLRAYFLKPLPRRGVIEFGYGDEVMLQFPQEFRRESVERLDPGRLPENTVR